MNESFDSTAYTLHHIRKVARLLNLAATDLLHRANKHDLTKLVEPEKSVFDKCIPELTRVVYGSDEYKAALEGMGEGLKHHYAMNSHHPEHYENGVNGFNLFDVMEMFFDWKAASERYPEGNFKESVAINCKRFGISDQLKEIMLNTIDLAWVRITYNE